MLEEAGVRLGDHYPMPIVTLAESQAALMHANGIIMRCQMAPPLQAEPYRGPTAPIDVRRLPCWGL